MQQLINQAVQEFEEYQRLTAQGKLAEAGQKLEQHKRTLEELKRVSGKRNSFPLKLRSTLSISQNLKVMEVEGTSRNPGIIFKYFQFLPRPCAIHLRSIFSSSFSAFSKASLYSGR